MAEQVPLKGESFSGFNSGSFQGPTLTNFQLSLPFPIHLTRVSHHLSKLSLFFILIFRVFEKQNTQLFIQGWMSFSAAPAK